MLFLTSCATLINTKYTEVNLYSKQDSLKVYFNDTSNYSYAPTKLIVKRSREPLFLTIYNILYLVKKEVAAFADTGEMIFRHLLYPQTHSFQIPQS